jgi:hypothetical protein
MWALVNLVCHRGCLDDFLFAADELNSEFRSWLSLLTSNLAQSSREFIGIEPLKRVVPRKEPKWADLVDPL